MEDLQWTVATGNYFWGARSVPQELQLKKSFISDTADTLTQFFLATVDILHMEGWRVCVCWQTSVSQSPWTDAYF